MSLRKFIHKDARIALSRTQGRRTASWLIMAACLGVMMLLWGVPLPGWVFGIIVAVPFVALFALGNYWAGVDELAAAKAGRKPVAKAAPKTTARPAATPGAKPGARPAGKRSAKARSKRHH
jgi:hypothetical protein